MAAFCTPQIHSANPSLGSDVVVGGGWSVVVDFLPNPLVGVGCFFFLLLLEEDGDVGSKLLKDRSRIIVSPNHGPVDNVMRSMGHSILDCSSGM